MPSIPQSLSRLGRSTLFRLLAVAAILVLPVACKSSDKPKPIGRNVELSGIDRLIHQTLRDPPRANAVIALINEAEYELGEINKVYDKRQGKFSKMVVDHDTPGRELDLFIQQWEAEERVFRQKLINTVSEIKRRMSPDEWTRIAPSFMNSIFAQSDRLNNLLRPGGRPLPPPTARTSAPPPNSPPVIGSPSAPNPATPPPPITPTPTPTSSPAPLPPPPPNVPSSTPPPTTLPPPPNFNRELAPLPPTQ